MNRPVAVNGWLVVVALIISAMSSASAQAAGEAAWPAQVAPGQWTWASGSDRVAEKDAFGIYGTKGVAAPGNAPGARQGGVSWTDASGNLWLFGGEGYAASGSGYLNDLWKWDGASWTWVSGSDERSVSGVYGTKGVAAAGNVPGARHGAVSWRDASGNLWLFGGYGYAASGAGYLNDLWKWDGTNWTWVSGANTRNQTGVYGAKGVPAPENVPGARYGAVSWRDASGNLWLFGGQGYAASGSGYLNDLWKWTGSSWIWVSGSNATNQAGAYGVQGVPAPGNVPGARQGAVSWTDGSGISWLFGGNGYATGGSGYLNDLWVWSGTEWAWVNGSNAPNQAGAYGVQGVPAPGNVPGARYRSVSWRDAAGNLWLFGGNGHAASGSGNLNDLWKWSGSSWTWVSGSNAPNQVGVYGTIGVPAAGNIPGARMRGVSWRDASGNLWHLGGSGYATTGLGYLNDLWRWDGVNWTWAGGSSGPFQLGVYGAKGVPAAGNVPGARHGAVSWRDASGNLWLFGGYGYAASGAGYLNDLWKWDGTNWTWVSGSNAPGQFGVYGTKGEPEAGNVPGARQDSVSWRDAGGDLWLFGGYGYAASGSGYLNDLWKWDGTSWTWVSGSNLAGESGVYGSQGFPEAGNVPGARGGSVSWTDASGNLWLFGGMGHAASGSGYLNDLWKWDGENWTWVSGSNATYQYGVYGSQGVPAPENVPGARERPVSWGDASGNFWIFGGYGYAASGSGYLNDLWKWDGTSWTWVSGSNAPYQVGVYGTQGVPAPGNVPGSRLKSVSWGDASGNFWIFGGYGYAASTNGELNDLWKWDGTSWTWVSGSSDPKQAGVSGTKGVAGAGNVPGGRPGSVSWTDASGNLWLFGGGIGYDSGGLLGTLNDLWVFGPPCTPPPAPTAGNGGAVCAGGTIALTASTVAGATYSWTGPNGFTSALQNPTIANATNANAGPYSVTASVGLCTSSAGTTAVVVLAAPALPVITAPPSLIPEQPFTASVPQAAGVSYAWDVTNGTITGGDGTREISVRAASTGPVGITVTETDTVTSCASEATVSIPLALPATRFYPVTPCRLFDTREATGERAGAPVLAPDETRTYAIGSRCGLGSAQARSLSVNVTVTGPTAAGELIVFRGDLPADPTASSISYKAGATRANNGILELSRAGDGTIKVRNRSTGEVHFILDVNGYFR